MLRVEFERLDRRLSLVDAAKEIGIPRGDLSRIESGVLRPPPAHLNKLCAYYGLPGPLLLEEVVLAEDTRDT